MKALILSGVVGLLFMVGGFWVGMKIAPKPVLSKSAATAGTSDPTKGPGIQANPPPITIATLEKTSQSMVSLNDALRAREQAVAQREQAVKQREDELDAERAALDASHNKFKALFNEFQSRLQLVDANQTAQLQKQADLYTSMGVDQSVDLIRVMDDASVSRLFSVMDTKPLGKMIAAWKNKYPEDVPRVLRVLDGMAQVMPKEKIALDTPSTESSDSGSLTGSPDDSTPAAAPAADASSAPAPAATPDANGAPAPDANATPSADGNMNAATPDSTPGNPSAAPATTPSPSPDSNPPLTPPADPAPAPAQPSGSNGSTASN